MEEGVFGVSTRRPTSEDVARELGRSWAAWQTLMSGLSDRFPPLTEEWKFAGAHGGWSLKVKRKKRTVIYLRPCRKYFRVALILGDKAVKKALQSELPKPVVTEVRRAKKYPEGRVLRFEIRFKKELSAIMHLAEAKMST